MWKTGLEGPSIVQKPVYVMAQEHVTMNSIFFTQTFGTL